MAKKKDTTVTPIDANATPQTVAIRPKTNWMGLLKKAAETHWRRLHVTIRVREKLMAGKPAHLDAAEAMLRARDLEAAIEAVNIDDPNELAAAAATAVKAGLCEFHRREGKPGIWFPTNHIKAGIKENWSVLGKRNEHRGSRGALAEGVFVYAIQDVGAPKAELDWIYLGEKADGVDQSVTHTDGPRGPISSIKRNEYVLQPTIRFEVAIARAIADKLPDDAMASVLLHFGEHGLGACRSQGFGRFDIENIVEIEPTNVLPMQIDDAVA